ncbi:MAG: amino acid adenylation domain-containing protein [Sulfitobacter sp.]
MTDPQQKPAKPKREFSRKRLQQVTQQAVIPQLDRDGTPLRASGSQCIFWYLSQNETAGAAYVLQSALRITGPVNVQALAETFDLLSQQHEGLRTRFRHDGQTLTLDVVERATPFAFNVENVKDAQAMASVLAGKAALSMDLAKGPLARATLFTVSPQEHVLLVLLHHTIADHTSFALLWPEICATYTALHAGAPAPEFPQTLPYADYAAWEADKAEKTGLARERAFWDKTLADTPALSSPTPDHNRSVVPDYKGAVVELRLDWATAEALNSFALGLSVTPFAVGLAAWVLFLQDAAGQSDVVTASPVTQRDRPELARTVGPFVNTLALRFGPVGMKDAADWVRHVQRIFLDARDHQALPIDQVIECAGPARSPSHNPLYQTMFSWNEGSQSETIPFGSATAQFAPLEGHTAQLDLTLDVVQRTDGIVAQFEYATALYSKATVQGFADRFNAILTQLIAMPDGIPATMDDVRASRPSILKGGDAPEPASFVHDQIATWAKVAAQDIAIVDADQNVSYRTLDRRANHLAQRLSDSGIGPGTKVAISLPKTAATFTAALAVLKVGAAYVPIDSDVPEARLSFIIGNCGASALIVAEGAATVQTDAQIITYPFLIDAEQDTPPPLIRALVSTDTAYVIYTSGSTGQPKGVAVSHGAIAQMVANWGDLLNLSTPPVVLQMASFAFDVAVADFLRALCFGGRLVLCSKAVVIDPAALSEHIRTHHVTLADFTPAVIDQLAQLNQEQPGLFESFRHIICGSDLWALHNAQKLRQLCPHPCQILHAYGLTETTVDALFFNLNDLSGKETVLPLGRPVAGMTVSICDSDLRPVPLGQQGEICLTGGCLADGYIGAPDLTATRFVTLPDGRRQFRTGDVGRINASGQVEFLGRADTQIKIRGYRIDPGEIENHLLNAGAASAFVTQYKSHLVAYVSGETTTQDLRSALSKHLPDYLRPTSYVMLDRLPLTSNGKVDVVALPVPVIETEYMQPEGQPEEILATLWQEMLGGGPVGRNDNFFERGGHSMLAVRMAVEATKRLGCPVEGAAIFAMPTLQGFAGAIGGSDSTRPALTRRHRAVQVPASFAQEAMWFLAQDPGQNAAYNMPFALQLLPDTDQNALRQALQAVVDRHEALRAGFETVNGLPVLAIHGHVDLPFRTLDVSAQHLPDIAAQEATTPFDLTAAPLIRVCWAHVNDGADVVFITLHHIISDGWSIDIFAHELAQLYGDFAQGHAASLPILDVQFGDYTQWQRDAVDPDKLSGQLAFWQKTLGGAPALLPLPTDRPRPTVQDFNGARIDLTIDAATVVAVHQFARENATTVFNVVIAAWQYMLGKLSGETDVVTGVPTANRHPAETEKMIGFFVNTLAIRADHSDASTPRDLISQLTTIMAQAQAHQDVPFSKVVEHLNPVRTRSHAPVFQTMLAWETAADAQPEQKPPFESYPVGQHHAKYDLLLEIAGNQTTISGSLQFATSLFDTDTAAQFCDYFKHILTVFVAHPDADLRAVGLADPDTVLRAQARWQVPFTPIEPTNRILPRFAASVQKSPSATALQAGDQTLSYAALGDLSDRLAQHLHEHGLGKDQPVAIWANRSLETIVFLLAILKAGGAVLPLDPSHPTARIDYILKDAAPLALLTNDPSITLPDCFETGRVWTLTCEAISALPTSARPLEIPDATQASYVLYTSGTTGQPKGVVQTHQMLDNLMDWQLAQTGRPSRVLQFASLTFDVSFQEILSTLCGGACLVLITPDQTRDVAALAELIIDQNIERAFLPVAVLQVLGGMIPAERTGKGCEIITAGEALKLSDTLRRGLPNLGGGALHNQYGPTETHVVSQYTLPMSAAAHWPDVPPIGTPISNTNLYVLDAAQQPVPDGVTGELYISGYGVARGYLNRADLTQDRFLPDPFADTPDAWMFKSGDLVRRRSDGVIDYIGRADDQVKIRGYRVEPSEAEAILRKLPDVVTASVVARTNPTGQTCLVAYFTGDADAQDLRRALLTRMPDYMCPTEWVHLPQLPLNTSGKVDRTALPEPDWQGQRASQHPLMGDTQTVLAKIWCGALGLDAVFADDNFFALGGHSLLAARIVFEINRSFASGLRLSDLFAAPVLADLARLIDAATAAPDDSQRVDILPQITADPDNQFAPFPLSDIQQAYLVGRQDQLSLGGVAAHSYNELRITGFDVPRFNTALNQVINRHDMLRVIFTADGQQQVLENTGPYQIAVQDVAGQDAPSQDAALTATRNRMSHQVLDAGIWPLFAFEVTRLSEDVVHLHMSLDALIVDAASTSLFMRELLAFYFDPELSLPPVGVSFRDYILAEKALRTTPPYQNALSYWMTRFEHIPKGPDLPLVCDPENLKSPQFVRRDKVVPAETWQTIKHNAAAEKITPSGMLLAAFCLVLRRFSQSPEFSLSLPVFNRLPLHEDVGSVIGDFTSVLLFQNTTSAQGSFADYAKSVQKALWRDMDHAQVSGIEIMRELGRKHGQQPAGLPVVFNSTLTEMVQPAPIRRPQDRLDAQSIHTITQTPQVWLDHTIMEEDGALVFNWDSIDTLFPAGLMDAMFADYLKILETLEKREGWTTDNRGLLSLDPTEIDIPSDLPTLHDMFLAQANRTPDNPAVVSSHRTLSYGTVQQEAQILAATLQQKGCGKGAIVALLLAPGWEQTVGVLATLIAGGAYLPLDPDLPQERVQKILSRTGAHHVLVADGFAAHHIFDKAINVIPICAEPKHKTPTPVTSGLNDLAYVIFTSGSTGEPKGVMIDHGGATNTILDINTRIGLGPQDRILGVSALNFDLSVYDIFGPLAVGAALVLPDADKHRDPAHWADLIAAHGVTIWNSVPALMGLLAEASVPPQVWSQLRVSMMSGDWIPLDLPTKIRAHAPDIVLWSLGGATEASIWSIGHLIGTIAPDWTSIPYGKAMTGQSIHILDDALGERPDMISGDIYIGGRGLAMGYWNDPARTDAAFVTHPRTGMRLYKTGDLGRRQPDGTIIFLGRADSQVKVQGYRIELGEVEAALERHPQVDAAAVRVWGEAMQAKRLAGYVVTAAPAPPEGELRDHLAQILPAYAIPSSLTFLDQLPLSANGKVDRKQLPEPTLQASTNEQISVQPGPEQDLVRIVCETLKQPDIASDINLLGLGASSLDIVRICNAVAAELDFRPPLAKFMRAPTLATLIEMWRVEAPAKPDAAPATDKIETLENDSARAAFKSAEKGRRRFDGDVTRIPLTRNHVPPSEPDRFEANRSVRQFAPSPIDAAQFATVLTCLMQNENKDRPRFQFSSAGGLYPVQTYLSVKPGRITGVPAGCYYLDPKAGCLVAVGDGTQLTADAYDYFVNRPTFDGAAFAVFFVMDRAAIEPVYGERSRDMALIEAGQMAQHLTNQAGEIGLGLCGIGDLDADVLNRLFGLGPHHALVYSMLGGRPETRAPIPPIETEEFVI